MKPLQAQSIQSQILNRSGRVVPSTEIQLKCAHEKTLFLDQKFQANLFSLIGAVRPAEYKNEWDVFQWKRPDQIWPIGSYQFIQAIHPSQIRQGFLNNTYLLSAISILAEHPFLITRLFTTPSISHTGVYGVWLHINGAWTEVVVDDLLPVFINDKGLTEFAFSHTPNNEFWLQILEKAYAKAYGSYYTISGGTLALALNDLTGAPCETIRLNQGEDLQELWRSLEAFERRACIMALNIRPNHAITQANTGLEPGMGYGIQLAREIQMADGTLAKLVKLKSNWNKINIEKLWPESKKKWNDRMKEALGDLHEPDGSFWLPLNLALNYFDELVICRLNPNYFFTATSMAANKFNLASMWVAENMLAEVSVIQEDLRSRRKVGTANLKYHFCRLTILEMGNIGFRFVKSVFGNQRALTIEEQLTAGNYIILVEFYLPLYSQPTFFSVELYSSSVQSMIAPCEHGNPLFFLDTELEGWKAFADSQADTWKPQGKDPHFKTFLQKIDGAYLQIEAIQNTSNPPASIAYERAYQGGGIEVNANQQGEAFVLKPIPGRCDVAIIKHNPLNPEVDFTISGFVPVCSPFVMSPNKTQEVLQQWHTIYAMTKQAATNTQRAPEGGCGSKCALI